MDDSITVPTSVFSMGGHDACENVQNYVAKKLGITEKIVDKLDNGSVRYSIVYPYAVNDVYIYFSCTMLRVKASSLYYREDELGNIYWNGGFRTITAKAVLKVHGVSVR